MKKFGVFSSSEWGRAIYLKFRELKNIKGEAFSLFPSSLIFKYVAAYFLLNIRWLIYFHSLLPDLSYPDHFPECH